MKFYHFAISVLILSSCSSGSDKSAKEIAKENGENYCKCLEEDVKKGGVGTECSREASLSFEKALDAGKFEEADVEEATKLYRNMRDKCNAEHGLGGEL